MGHRLGGGKSLVAGARIRPTLLERSPTPFASHFHKAQSPPTKTGRL